MSKTKVDKELIPRRRPNPFEVIFYIFGVLFLVLAFLFGFEVITRIGDFDLQKFTAGIALIVIGFLLNVIRFKKKDQVGKTISIIEIIFVFIPATLGFIVPAFSVENPTNLGTPGMWLAIILLFHGIVRLSLAQFQGLKLNWLDFIVNVALLILAGVVLGLPEDVIADSIRFIVTGILAVISILCIAEGFAFGHQAKKRFEAKLEAAKNPPVEPATNPTDTTEQDADKSTQQGVDNPPVTPEKSPKQTKKEMKAAAKAATITAAAESTPAPSNESDSKPAVTADIDPLVAASGTTNTPVVAADENAAKPIKIQFFDKKNKTSKTEKVGDNPSQTEPLTDQTVIKDVKVEGKDEA